MLLSLSLLLNLALFAPPQNPEQVAEFTRIVFEADEVGDSKAMQAALRKYKEDAIIAFIGRVEMRLDEDLPEMEKWLSLFTELWEETYNTNFAKNYDRYIQRLSTKQRDIRSRLLQRDYPEISKLHFKIISAKSGDWQNAVERAEQLAESFTALADLYYVALAHNIVANLYNPNYYEHEKSSSDKAFASYKAAVAARDRLGLRQDKFYTDLKVALTELESVLGNHEEKVTANKEKATRETIPLKVDTVTATGAVAYTVESAKSKLVHASDVYDSDYYSWMRGVLPAIGESIAITKVMPMVTLVRIDNTKYRLEAGAEPSAEFKLGPQEQLVTVMRKHENDEEHPYSILFMGGSQDSVYQGIKINLEPSPKVGTYFYRSPSTRDFDTEIDTVRIYDTNVDGQFGYDEFKLAWCEGLLPDEWFWRPDAISLGKQKVSQPFSRYIFDKKGEWYEVVLDSSLNPKSLSLVPVAPILGEIKFSHKGIKKLKPLSVLIASESSATKGLVIDLMAMPKKRFVPIGRYKFLQARFGDKEGSEVLVTPDPNKVMLFDVGDDTEEVPELFIGGDFSLVAPATLDGMSLHIEGRGLHLVGDNGERWFRFAGEPMFDVEVMIKGQKPSVLAMPSVDEASEIWDRFFYPMAASLELAKPATEVEVTLVYKKHPWFGNLKSTFTVKSK
ncbi:MAG: hypothetical protein ACI84O_001458 [Myxococcota bacterium]|jgi:hypothetical protein